MTDKTAHVAQKSQNHLVLSYLAVRRIIGALGYFLPIALALYGLLVDGRILTSMSAYYYTPMREVFVGTLIAQAVFLWSYRGYHEPGRMVTDKVVARIAAVAVSLIALAPTARAIKADPALVMADDHCTLLQCVLGDGLASLVHLIAAGSFFAALAVYCLVLFVRGTPDTPEKRASNRIYRICGWLILGSIGLIGILFVTGLDLRLAWLSPVFWLEVVACFAFATSWAVKGDALGPMVRMMAKP